MESLVQIVKGTTARIVHVCFGKVVYQIETINYLYPLEINSMDQEWETTYLTPEFKAIMLMRWIGQGIKNQDGSFIHLR